MAKHGKTRQSGPKKGSPRSLAGHQGAPWIYGIHAVLAALANPMRRHQRLVVSRDGAAALQSRLTQAAEAGDNRAMNAEVVDKAELENLLPAQAVHQGLALLSPLPPPPDLENLIESAKTREKALLVILDQASDPHNIGAVLRSAAAFGAMALILPDRHSPDVTGVLAKAASGALERVPMIRVTNLARTLERLKATGFWCIGLDGSARTTLPKADLPPRTALVLGAEGGGLRRLTGEHCDLLVNIPIGERMESLNLSNAAAIVLYEYARKYG